MMTIREVKHQLKKGNATIEYDHLNSTITYKIYSEETGFVELAKVTPDTVEGVSSLSEVEPTIIATIEKNIREHPVMGKYADMILGDFNNILCLDPEREIEQIPEAAIVNATLREENQRKDNEIKRLQAQVERLQGMLSKTLAFAKGVKDHAVGKLLFGKKIEELDLPQGELPEGKEER